MKKTLLLLLTLMCSVGIWAEEVTIATFSYTSRNAELPSGWTESSTKSVSTSTGNYYLLSCYSVASATLTSPSIDFSLYSQITIEFGAGRYGGLTGSKANITAKVGTTTLGSIEATGTSEATYKFEYTNALSANAPIVFTCPTEPSSTNTDGKVGARIYSITIKGTPKGGPVVNVTGISLNQSYIKLFKGKSTNLVATIAPSNATNKGVVWVSNNDDIAKVDDNGKVTAVAAGTTTITAVSEDGEYEATCLINVVENPIIYKWDGTGSTSAATQEGGTASVPIESSTNIVAGASQKGNWTFKINKGVTASGGPFVILITLNKALKAGDVITGAVFRSSDSDAILGIDFLAANASASAEYTISNPQILTSNGTPLDNISFVVPESADGKNVIRIYRQSGGTGLYVSKFMVARPQTFDLTIGDCGWASMAVDFNAEVPEGTSAYYASAKDLNGESGTITLKRIAAGEVIPAGEGVVVKGSGPVTFVESTKEPVTIANLFSGTATAPATVAASSAWVLNATRSTSDAPYFSLFTGTTIPVNKSYLSTEKVGGAKTLVFAIDDDTATSINTLENAKTSRVAYNLAGQRVAANAKGIVIINGKKFINK